jgi:hypothetical protein
MGADYNFCLTFGPGQPLDAVVALENGHGIP